MSDKDKIRRRVKPATEEEFISGSKSEAVEKEEKAKPAGRGVGRPQTHGEPTRNKTFYLPLSMVDRIDQESREVSGNNATAFAIKIFDAYFVAKDEGRPSEAYGIELRPKK